MHTFHTFFQSQPLLIQQYLTSADFGNIEQLKKSFIYRKTGSLIHAFAEELITEHNWSQQDGTQTYNNLELKILKQVFNEIAELYPNVKQYDCNYPMGHTTPN